MTDNKLSLTSQALENLAISKKITAQSVGLSSLPVTLSTMNRDMMKLYLALINSRS